MRSAGARECPKGTRAGKKPQPNLLFAEKMRKLHSFPHSSRTLESLSMTNVVMLTSLNAGAHGRFRCGMRRRGVYPPFTKTNAGVSQWSHEIARTKRAHYRIGTVGNGPLLSDGKFLIFSTNNIIRAGKYTHCDAVNATLRMLGFLKLNNCIQAVCYPAVISSPNSVVTGKCAHPIDAAKLKSHWQAHCTPRFPGIAINLNVPGVVPEVYPSDGRFILPGVRHPDQLIEATNELMAILAKCADQPTNGADSATDKEDTTTVSESETP